MFVSEKVIDNAEEKKQTHESRNTGDQNTRSQNHTAKTFLNTIDCNVISNNIPSQDTYEHNEKSFDIFVSNQIIERNENETIRTNKSSRNASIDSTEDSGDWDDPELTRLLPNFSAIEEQLNERRMPFSVC